VTTETAFRGELTERDFEEASKLIGVDLRRTSYGGSNTGTATDTIVRFCDGISDENPLHRDTAYGAASPYGSIVAPYFFLLSIDRGIGAPGLPGVQYINGGTDHFFYRPLLNNEPLGARVKLVDVQWREGRRAGRFIDQVAETEYFNRATSEVVAKSYHHVFRVVRRHSESDSRGYTPRGIYHYTPEEIEQLEAAIDAEVIRGATPLFWEDVSIGDAIPGLVKPVLTITDILQWYSGVGCIYRAHEMAWKHRRTHPGDSHPDPRTGVPGHPGRGHLEGDMARAAGMPGIYDVGNQRLCWLAQMVDHWMGDEGHIARHDAKITRPNVEGDTSWCKGVVHTKQELSETVGQVTCETWIDNQYGEKTTEATIVVELPRRGGSGRHGSLIAHPAS
jgi:acyl dehydratase